MTSILLIGMFLPIAWGGSMGIMALFTATMEVLDRDH